MRRLLALLLLGLPAWAVCPNPANGYSYCRKLVIGSDKVSGAADLTNFPVLVSFGASWLKTTPNGGKVQDGNDLRFELPDATKLDHEIESWNGAGGALTAWVRLPVLNADADTVLYVYYGKPGASGEENAAGVWADYERVYHFNEDPSTAAPQIHDAASGTANARSYSMASGDLVVGKVASALDFEDPKYAEIDDESVLENFATAGGVVSLWMNCAGLDPHYKGIVSDRAAGENDNFFQIQTGSASCRATVILNDGVRGDIVESGILSNSDWHHVVAVWSTSVLQLFVDGVSKGSDTLTDGIWSNTDKFLIARHYGASYFPGLVDELRLRNDSVIDADWIATEYNNQSAPSAFLAVGGDDYGGDPIAPPPPAFRINGVIGDD